MDDTPLFCQHGREAKGRSPVLRVSTRKKDFARPYGECSFNMDPIPSQTLQDPARAQGPDPFAESGMEPPTHTSLPLGDRLVDRTARPGSVEYRNNTSSTSYSCTVCAMDGGRLNCDWSGRCLVGRVLKVDELSRAARDTSILVVKRVEQLILYTSSSSGTARFSSYGRIQRTQ